MKLTDLAAKPQLIKVILDDEETVAEFKEALEFWTWDRQPIEIYLKLAESANKGNGTIGLIKELLLDEEGTAILKDGQTLPGPVLFKAVNKLVEALGK